MKSQPKEELERGWTWRGSADKVTGRGLSEYEKQFNGSVERELLDTYSKWKKSGSPGGAFRVLDLGAGKGRALRGMLSRLKREQKREEEPRSKIQVIHHNLMPGDFGEKVAGKRVMAEATALPFRDGSIHFVTSVWAIPYVKDKLAALREIDRVLHPTGKALVHVSHFINDGGRLVQEEITHGKRSEPLKFWLARQGIQTKQNMKLGSLNVSFEKGIKLPETRVTSCQKGEADREESKHVVSRYEVVKEKRSKRA